MLKPHEIFAKMPGQLASDLIQFLHENEKAVYKVTLDRLAQQRKLRPVFIERKSRKEQHLWVKEQVSRPHGEAIAAQLLQIWLVGAHKPMLCDFLDSLKISHDENGTVDNLPESPAKPDVANAVDLLLSKYSPTLVSVYLHAFQGIDGSGWSSLGEILSEDSRLKLDA